MFVKIYIFWGLSADFFKELSLYKFRKIKIKLIILNHTNNMKETID